MSTSRVAVVVGGNKGLGYEQVKQLAQAHPDWTILLGARSEENANTAIKKMKGEDAKHSFENVHFLQIDVTNSASIKNAVATTQKHGGVDFFIFNAGIADYKGDYQGAVNTLDVNVFGMRNTVEAFLPLMRPISTGAKIIVVSSEVGAWSTAALKGTPLHDTLVNDAPKMTWEQINELVSDYLVSVKKSAEPKNQWPEPSATFASYGISKVFVNAYCRMFAAQHASDYHIVMVCPGYCATELNNFQGPRSAAVGGTSVIYPVEHKTESGHFYQDGNEMSFSTPMPDSYKQQK